jgi:hypothetical protein
MQDKIDGDLPHFNAGEHLANELTRLSAAAKAHADGFEKALSEETKNIEKGLSAITDPTARAKAIRDAVEAKRGELFRTFANDEKHVAARREAEVLKRRARTAAEYYGDHLRAAELETTRDPKLAEERARYAAILNGAQPQTLRTHAQEAWSSGNLAHSAAVAQALGKMPPKERPVNPHELVRKALPEGTKKKQDHFRRAVLMGDEFDSHVARISHKLGVSHNELIARIARGLNKKGQ